MSVTLLPFVLPLLALVQFSCGAFLLWRGLSLTSDKAWKEHVERLAAQGLYPERNAYWERSARWARILPTIAGIAFLCMAGLTLHTILSAPFAWWAWW